MHFDVIEGRMNSEKFIEYLVQLRSDTRHPVLVIADNSRLSPELNPDEQVWNHAKGEVGNKCAIRSKDDMERIILSAMKMIQGKTDLIKSFFKLPDTKYAQDCA